MDIREVSNNNGANRIFAQEAYRAHPPREAVDEARDIRASRKAEDRAELSEEARAMLARALDSEATTELRDEKVKAIQRLVESGSYQVDPRQLAGIMMARLHWTRPEP